MDKKTVSDKLEHVYGDAERIALKIMDILIEENVAAGIMALKSVMFTIKQQMPTEYAATEKLMEMTSFNKVFDRKVEVPNGREDG